MNPSREASRPRAVAKEVAKLAKDLLGQDLEVIWFGSWPKGVAHPSADIDLALSGRTPIPLERIARLREAIDRLPTLYQVDVVDFSVVGADLRDEILKYGVKL